MVSTAGGGDNGDVRGLDTLFADDALAVMPAVDALRYSLSHFDNSDIWFKASYDLNVKTGWLGRWIDRNGSPTNPLQAISIDTALSKSIRTAVNPVCAIPSLTSLGFNMNSPGGTGNLNVNAQMQALAGVPAAAHNAYLSRARGTYGVAVETDQRADGGPAYAPGAGYPNNGTLSTRLRLAAHLLAANLGTRIITIHWGSFDTHSGQLASQDAQLMELSRALGAFRADLQARGIENRVSHAGVLRVRPARRRERLGGDRPRRRRADAGDGQQACAAAWPPNGPAAGRRTSCPSTTRPRAT